MKRLRVNRWAVIALLSSGMPLLAQWASCTGGPAGSLCLSLGNLGVGTTSPANPLTVIGIADGITTQKIIANGNLVDNAGLEISVPNVTYPKDIQLDDTWAGIYGAANLIARAAAGNLYLQSYNGIYLYPGVDHGGANYNFAVNTNGLAVNNGATGPGSGIGLIVASGKVGIGTTTPCGQTAPSGCVLTVNGGIQAKEIVVNAGWSDYVFDPSYRLQPLGDVAAYVKENKHLPGIPSAQEVAEKGISVGDIQSKLLSKIEELTLHMIDIEKENHDLQRRLEELEKDEK